MSYNSKLHNYDFLASFFSGIAILPSLLLFLSTAVWAIANHVISSLFAAQLYLQFLQLSTRPLKKSWGGKFHLKLKIYGKMRLQ